MAVVRFEKVIGALPETLSADTLYLVRTGVGFDLHVSDTTGAVAHKLNADKTLSMATLTHTSGTIDLDADAADVFEFEAEDHTPASDIALVDAGHTSGSSLDVSGWGLEQDDLLILVSAYSSGAPAGFTLEFEVSSGGSQDMYVFSKRMGASPDTSISLFSSRPHTVSAWRGVSQVQMFDVTEQTTGPANDNDFNCPSITTVTDGALILAAITATNVNPSGGTIAGYTLAAEGPAAAFSNFAGQWYKAQTSAGSEDPPSHSYSGSNKQNAEATMALRRFEGVGEKNYTLNITNKPTGAVVKPLAVYLDVKTTAGSWDISAIDEWIGGVPDLNVAGKHAIEILANATLTVAEYKGLVA